MCRSAQPNHAGALTGAALLFFAILTSVSATAGERKLSGNSALQTMAGKSFSFKCDDQMHGYGRFVSRTSAWASYKYGTSNDELERRSEASVRINGDELCFKSTGVISGEVCAVFSEKSVGIYRVTSKDGWCDLRVSSAFANE